MMFVHRKVFDYHTEALPAAMQPPQGGDAAAAVAVLDH